MKSQVRYNTQTQLYLTQMPIYLVDNHRMTYEEFNELTDISQSQFSKILVAFKEMLNDLKINAAITSEEIDVESNVIQFNETSFKTKVYYFQMPGEDYTFDYLGLSEEKLVTYSMKIVYLMLKNGQYVTTKELSSILPNYNRSIMMVLMEKLRGIVSNEIELNETNSYIVGEE